MATRFHAALRWSAVETHAVHHQIVERSDLLSERALLLRLIGILQDEFLDTLLIEFLKVDESTVLGMLCVQRMALEPTTSGVVSIPDVGVWAKAPVQARARPNNTICFFMCVYLKLKFYSYDSAFSVCGFMYQRPRAMRTRKMQPRKVSSSAMATHTPTRP